MNVVKANQWMPSSSAHVRRFMLGASLAAFALGGCGYPEVSSKTYQIAKSLYSICNLEQEERLSMVSQIIEQAHEQAEVTDREAAWLKAIVTDAEAGDWETAEAESRRLMQDQIK